MSARNLIVSEDVEAPYLVDPALYEALPVYTDLVDGAVAAEMEWLNAKAAGQDSGPRNLLDAYTARLVSRQCRLSGTLLSRSGPPGGHRARAMDLYVKIRLAAPSSAYRDRIYECHYAASPSIEGSDDTIKDLTEAKIGEEVHLVGWLDRSFCVPGFYLARPRLYRGSRG